MSSKLRLILSFLDHWKKALTGPVVTIVLLLYQQTTGKPPTWGWFAAIVLAAFAWQFWSELRDEKASHAHTIATQSQKTSGDIIVKVNEVHVQSKLQGYGKRNVTTDSEGKKTLAEDPAVGWDVFLHVTLVSTFTADMGIQWHSLTLRDLSGNIIKSNGPIQDLQYWKVDRITSIPEIFGHREEKTSEPIESVTSTLPSNIFSKGWIHFFFDGVRMSQIQAGTLTLSVMSARGDKYYATVDGPRSYSGDVWPVNM